MKLIKFDITNSSQRRSAKSCISFNSKTGVITIGRLCVENIKLAVADLVSIVQDEDEPNDWFLIINDKDGFTLREGKGGVLQFSSTYIARSIIDSFAINAVSVSFDLAEEKTDNDEFDMYAIITGTAKYREIKN